MCVCVCVCVRACVRVNVCVCVCVCLCLSVVFVTRRTHARTHTRAHIRVDGRCCPCLGNLLQDPVRSPYGNVFDKPVILQCLKKLGRRCPLTGNPLTKSELVPDDRLHDEIRRWQLAEAQKETTAAEAADDMDGRPRGDEEEVAEEEGEEEDPLYVFD